MKIQFYKKNVYGVEKFYLKNNGKQEEAMLRLIGQKTISEEQMKLFEELGIIFEQVLN